MGRRLDLLPSSRSCSNPTGRWTDARLGGMGRDTPIFSCFCIPTPFLPWAKNTWTGWTGKIIRIKELSRPCVQPLPWLLPLPFDQNGFPKHGPPFPTWMTYLFIPIPYIPLSFLCTLHPSSPLHATPSLLYGCISHSLMVPLSHATPALGTYSFPQSTFLHLLPQFISKWLFSPKAQSFPLTPSPPSPLHPSYLTVSSFLSPPQQPPSQLPPACTSFELL